MATEYEIMMNCRLCTQNQIFNNNKLRSTGHSKGNKTVPEKVATTRTKDGHK
jgi:hypothetical protein